MENREFRVTCELDKLFKEQIERFSKQTNERFAIFAVGEGFRDKNILYLNKWDGPVFSLTSPWEDDSWTDDVFNQDFLFHDILTNYIKTNLSEERRDITKIILSNTDISKGFVSSVGKKLKDITSNYVYVTSPSLALVSEKEKFGYKSMIAYRDAEISVMCQSKDFPFEVQYEEDSTIYNSKYLRNPEQQEMSSRLKFKNYRCKVCGVEKDIDLEVPYNIYRGPLWIREIFKVVHADHMTRDYISYGQELSSGEHPDEVTLVPSSVSLRA